MAKPFVPHIEEQTLTAVITKREGVLLVKLRKYPFGKFLVHKMDNKIMRVEIEDSQIIDETTEVDLS